MGFQVKNEYDSCVYLKEVCGGSLLYLLLYVDDMLMIAKDITDVKRVNRTLKGEFEIKFL